MCNRMGSLIRIEVITTLVVQVLVTRRTGACHARRTNLKRFLAFKL